MGINITYSRLLFRKIKYSRQQSANCIAGFVRVSTADSRMERHVLPDADAHRNPLRNLHQPLAFMLK